MDYLVNAGFCGPCPLSVGNLPARIRFPLHNALSAAASPHGASSTSRRVGSSLSLSLSLRVLRRDYIDSE